MSPNLKRYYKRVLANCRCLIIPVVGQDQQEQDPTPDRLSREMRSLLVNFPHSRHQPLEAIDALHQVRELRDRIVACHTDQGDHVQSQDAP